MKYMPMKYVYQPNPVPGRSKNIIANACQSSKRTGLGCMGMDNIRFKLPYYSPESQECFNIVVKRDLSSKFWNDKGLHTFLSGQIGHIPFIDTYFAAYQKGLKKIFGHFNAQGDGLYGRTTDVEAGNDSKYSYGFIGRHFKGDILSLNVHHQV